MIELRYGCLVFTFPAVHPAARLRVSFQRALRIPNDGNEYPLQPGRGAFPLRLADDVAARIPAVWGPHGGVMLPMYQAEAMWLNFDSDHLPEHATAYPFAIKVASGKVDAVTGKYWAGGLHRSPQDYLTAPPQTRLDGYCVEKGVVRQFVARLLGTGDSDEEQVTGVAERGGLQIAVYPMRREVFERRFPKKHPRRRRYDTIAEDACCYSCRPATLGMGLAPGGRMYQEIYEDPFCLEDWHLAHSSRCFVHIASSMLWRAITGAGPPTVPPTAREYTQAGLPWLGHYSDAPAVPGADPFKVLKSVAQLGKAPLPENEPVTAEKIVALRRGLAKEQVREGCFCDQGVR